MVRFTERSLVWVVIIAAILLVVLFRQCNPVKVVEPMPPSKVTIHDTIYVPKVVTIEGKAKIKYRNPKPQNEPSSGTISLADPCSFIASLDTIVGNDTLSLQYAHPEQKFDFSLRTKERIIYQKDSVTVPYPVEKIVKDESTNWLVTGIVGVSTFIIGLLIH